MATLDSFGKMGVQNPALPEEEESSINESDVLFGKIGEPKKISDAEQWAIDNPAQPMAPIDYSAAPSWWNEGRGGGNYGKIGQGQPAQAEPEAPSYAPAAPQQPRMIDYIGDVGGRTGITTTSPLSAALRGATPATGGSNG